MLDSGGKALLGKLQVWKSQPESEAPRMLRIPSTRRSLDPDAHLAIASWLPDETLFSLASRHHIVACTYSDSHTCRQLFGHDHLGSRHDFCSRIDVFVENTRGRFGEAEDIIFEHTLLPFYLPLNCKSRVEDAVRSMRGNSIGSLRYSMGMLANHFQARHPLKACELCMEEDVQRFRVAYWHRIHQYPGVWICPQHKRPLVESSQRGTSNHRYSWCLPRKDCLACPAAFVSSSDEIARLEHLERVTAAAMALAALAPRVFLDRERMGRVYLSGLTSLGLGEMRGKLRLTECIASILDNVTPLRSISEFSSLPATKDQAHAYVSRLCWRPVVDMHPLQHLFTIVWIFGNWENFWNAYELDYNENSGDAAIRYDVEVPSLDHNAAYRRELARLMVEERVGHAKTVPASSKSHGRTRGKGMSSTAEIRNSQGTLSSVWQRPVNDLERGVGSAAAVACDGIPIRAGTKNLCK